MRSAIAIGVFLTSLAFFALFGNLASAERQAADANVAPCQKAIIGHGRAGWRRESIVAGPVGVAKRPLRQMWRAPSGNLYAKMGILVAGNRPVTVRVPEGLRSRVFLYYGQMTGRDGKPTTSFADTPGYSSTEFRPCADRPRTIWPGGVRIRGTASVHLMVEASGSEIPLRLGRPGVYAPAR